MNEDVAPDSQQVFDDALSDASTNIDQHLRAIFSEPQYKKLRVIGAFIMRGLSVEESCVLAQVEHSKLLSLSEDNEYVAKFIRFKQIAYKASLMKTLAGSATEGRNMKSAGYLLENQFRNDFGKNRGDDGREPDAFEKALEFVRENGDKNPIVMKRLTPGTQTIT